LTGEAVGHLMPAPDRAGRSRLVGLTAGHTSKSVTRSPSQGHHNRLKGLRDIATKR
jgi:hypothetical protein